MNNTDYIIFYGAGCPTCEEIRLDMARLSYKRGFTYSEREVWHNAENQQLFDQLVDVSVDAVPVIYNCKTKTTWYGQGDLVDWIVV